jgi:two-component system, cell cycle sensor histidine kinase and response regulator CckA
VAHDFNNLLTVVTSYSGMLLAELPADNPTRTDIQAISDAADRAAALTRQLLAFSRQQVLEPQVIVPNDVIADMERMVRRLIPAHIRVVTRLDPAAGRIHVDPGQLEQVLMNLIVNARDAMPDGGTLTIETANVEIGEQDAPLHAGAAPGEYVTITVTDTGCGMTVEQQGRIFEPFFTTKQIGEGTGLGLSTAYGIVQQSGGSIWVYSELGQGTVFKVYLPRVAAPAEPRVLADRGANSIGGSETILLVEDTAPVRLAARRILKRAGYNVLEATNGAEAIALCEQPGITIDLLLTDMVMPELNGRELSTRFSELHPHAATAFMSGYMEEAIHATSVFAPGSVFIQKPFTPSSLIEKLREALDGARASAVG